jgi:hypothetical protein
MNSRLIPGIAITVLSLAVLLAFLLIINKTAVQAGWPVKKRGAFILKTILVMLGWLVLVGGLSRIGFFDYFDQLPPRPVLAIFLPLPFVLLFAFSRTGTALLKAIPPSWLIYMQSFRILVEVILWIAVTRAILPVQMSFEGRNFDIISGILALPVGWWVAKNFTQARSIAIIYNFIGLAFLLNILLIALLSMPTTFRYFHNDPSSRIVAEFPFIYLPSVLVVMAYTLHVFSLRSLNLRAVPKQAR